MAERIVVRSRKENRLMSLDNGWWKFKNCNIVALLRFSILSNCTGKGSSNLYPCTWENKLFCLFVIRLLEGGGIFPVYISPRHIYIFWIVSLCPSILCHKVSDIDHHKCHKHDKCNSVTSITVWQNVTSVTKCDKCDMVWKVWHNVTKCDKT